MFEKIKTLPRIHLLFVRNNISSAQVQLVFLKQKHKKMSVQKKQEKQQFTTENSYTHTHTVTFPSPSSFLFQLLMEPKNI